MAVVLSIAYCFDPFIHSQTVDEAQFSVNLFPLPPSARTPSYRPLHTATMNMYDTDVDIIHGHRTGGQPPISDRIEFTTGLTP